MVLGFTPTMPAISLLVLPSTTSFKTWRSRGLSVSSAAGLAFFFIPPVAKQCLSRNAYERPISEGAPPRSNLRVALSKVKPFFDFLSGEYFARYSVAIEDGNGKKQPRLHLGRGRRGGPAPGLR